MERSSTERLGWQSRETVSALQPACIVRRLGSAVFHGNTIITRSHAAVKVFSQPEQGCCQVPTSDVYSASADLASVRFLPVAGISTPVQDIGSLVSIENATTVTTRGIGKVSCSISSPHANLKGGRTRFRYAARPSYLRCPSAGLGPTASHRCPSRPALHPGSAAPPGASCAAASFARCGATAPVFPCLRCFPTYPFAVHGPHLGPSPAQCLLPLVTNLCNLTRSSKLRAKNSALLCYNR
jgi:hypothetical protein